jgi:DNA-binding LytR/AlgR family response regulator
MKCMRITVNQSHSYEETEIIVNCQILDRRLQNLLDTITQYSFSLDGYKENELYQVPAESIYYIDSVDGKTFLYHKEEVFRSRESLTALEYQLHNTPFVRIGKNCILNSSYLKSVKPIVNHRLQATLTNGEKLIISRNYIDALKEKLKK